MSLQSHCLMRGCGAALALLSQKCHRQGETWRWWTHVCPCLSAASGHACWLVLGAGGAGGHAQARAFTRLPSLSDWLAFTSTRVLSPSPCVVPGEHTSVSRHRSGGPGCGRLWGRGSCEAGPLGRVPGASDAARAPGSLPPGKSPGEGAPAQRDTQLGAARGLLTRQATATQRGARTPRRGGDGAP